MTSSVEDWVDYEEKYKEKREEGVRRRVAQGERVGSSDLSFLRKRALTRVPEKSVWVHEKSGAAYRVTGAALRESDLSPLIIYSPLRDTREDSVDLTVSFCRPESEWHERFKKAFLKKEWSAR